MCKLMAVVSVRIPRNLRDKLRKSGLNLSEEIRRYLTWLATREDSRKQLQALERLIEKLPRAPRGTAEKLVREDRDAH